MFYEVRRTYITPAGAEAMLKIERRSEYIEAASAFSAATESVRAAGTMLVGEIVGLPGDAATATCYLDGVTYVIRVNPVGQDEVARKRAHKWNVFRRRREDQKQD